MPRVFASSQWSCEAALSSLPFRKSGNLGLRGVCGLFGVLQSERGRGGTRSQAWWGHKSPSLLGMSSAHIGKAALPWACWDSEGTGPVLLPPGFCHCALSTFGGSRKGSPVESDLLSRLEPEQTVLASYNSPVTSKSPMRPSQTG